MTREDLAAFVARVPVEDLPVLLGLVAEAVQQLVEAGRAPTPPPAAASGDGGGARLLTVPEVAARTGMSPKWVRRHLPQLGAVHLGRAVRVPEAALARWLAPRARGRYGS